MVPHYRTILAFCLIGVLGYAAFSIWVVLYGNDPAIRGDVGGTWKSFAVGAMSFWVGSSMGGKARDVAATGKPDDPLNVTPAPEGSAA
jgi:hypothetical protein